MLRLNSLRSIIGLDGAENEPSNSSQSWWGRDGSVMGVLHDSTYSHSSFHNPGNWIYFIAFDFWNDTILTILGWQTCSQWKRYVMQVHLQSRQSANSWWVDREYSNPPGVESLSYFDIFSGDCAPALLLVYLSKHWRLLKSLFGPERVHCFSSVLTHFATNFNDWLLFCIKWHYMSGTWPIWCFTFFLKFILI